MAAAKSLTPAELERVLQYMSNRSFAQRNRAMLMIICQFLSDNNSVMNIGDDFNVQFL